jgi:hypothetical protein
VGRGQALDICGPHTPRGHKYSGPWPEGPVTSIGKVWGLQPRGSRGGMRRIRVPCQNVTEPSGRGRSKAAAAAAVSACACARTR